MAEDVDGVMNQLTAEMIQRGRGATPDDVARRRKVAQDMRAAREKLTSSTGLVRAFDIELIRLFAQYRVSATIPLLVLVCAIAATSCIWLPIEAVLMWVTITFLAMSLILAMSKRFLSRSGTEDEEKESIWSLRFALAEAVHGCAFAMIINLLLTANQSGARIFVLFVLLLVSAVTAMLSATVRPAVVAGLAPITASIGIYIARNPDFDTLTISAMAASGQLFFVFLAQRLYSSAVATLQSRAEKDALFIELEQAKANSDEARRRAEEANLAKSRFLATMSHELRTPLNAILGFSEVMKNEIFGPHTAPAYKEYSDDIHSSGQHLLNLINEILDLSRIEAGRYELKEEAINLAYIVDDCRHMLALRAKGKGQTIHDVIDATLPKLWADERAVRQVVLNILSNAIKFTPQGGEITVTVGWTSSGGQYVSVRDTGPGIPEEEIPVVMSTFGRGSLAIKTAEQGSGLGLPIVKGLVELHGGKFQLKSQLRVGTEVIVTFPSTRVMNALPAVPEQRSSQRSAA